MSSWTTAGGGSSCSSGSLSGVRSGCSSVRSSSIVSNSSTKLEELLDEHQRRSAGSTSLAGASSSLRLVEEQEEGKQEELLLQHHSAVNKLNFLQQAPRGWNNSNTRGLKDCRPDGPPPVVSPASAVQQDEHCNDNDYISDSAGAELVAAETTTFPVDLQQTSKTTGIQRQLSTIRQQKERLIRDILENERVGRDLTARAAELLTARDADRLAVFLAELEKVVLLLLSLGSRLSRAEAALLGCGNLTDWDKESIRYLGGLNIYLPYFAPEVPVGMEGGTYSRHRRAATATAKLHHVM
jgi:hypothetical protein